MTDIVETHHCSECGRRLLEVISGIHLWRANCENQTFKRSTEKTRISTSESYEILKKAIQDDDDYAWSWHCNIAVPFMDEGGTHEMANRAAARCMRTMFGVDVSLFDQWVSFEWVT